MIVSFGQMGVARFKTTKSRLSDVIAAAIFREMPTVALPAHFDGKQIVLDEPYDLPTNASLLVTLLPASGTDVEEDAWLKAIAGNGAFAFLADPAEDIYTLADGQCVPKVG